jgi:hypothetical protein
MNLKTTLEEWARTAADNGLDALTKEEAFTEWVSKQVTGSCFGVSADFAEISSFLGQRLLGRWIRAKFVRSAKCETVLKRYGVSVLCKSKPCGEIEWSLVKELPSFLSIPDLACCMICNAGSVELTRGQCYMAVSIEHGTEHGVCCPVGTGRCFMSLVVLDERVLDVVGRRLVPMHIARMLGKVDERTRWMFDLMDKRIWHGRLECGCSRRGTVCENCVSSGYVSGGSCPPVVFGRFTGEGSRWFFIMQVRGSGGVWVTREVYL